MTIATTMAKSRYAGDDSTTAFPTEFKFLNDDHVRVVLRAADGTETLWFKDTNYTISGAGDPGGGTVTATVAPATGETLVIRPSIPSVQETALPLGGAFSSTAVETMSDLTTLRDQQIEEALSRAVKFKETTALADIEFPEAEAGVDNVKDITAGRIIYPGAEGGPPVVAEWLSGKEAEDATITFATPDGNLITYSAKGLRAFEGQIARAQVESDLAARLGEMWQSVAPEIKTGLVASVCLIVTKAPCG